MKTFAKWMSVALLLAVAAVACSKDDSDASLTFEVPSVYFSAAGQQVVVTYSAKAVSRVYLSSQPTGWTTTEHVILDTEKRQLTILAPEAAEDGSVAASGTITINGYTSKDKVKSATLFVGVVPAKQLTGPANAFIAAEKETNYLFDLVRADGTPVQAARVGLVWQSSSRLIQNLYLNDNGQASFYIGADASYTDEIMRGNALIGAYDADDNLLWSWHIWSTSYDPEEDAIAWENGSRMMSRNLGAFDNANSTNAEKQASYGLYYQWGRKEPFIGPYDYKFSNGMSASLYTGDYTSTPLSYVESDAETGTEAYATAHPMTFILGVEENGYDWMWNSTTLDWSKKNNPCPAGWRVANAADFPDFLDGEPLLADSEAYGWPLTDGVSSSLFMAGGRRTYLNGYFQNIFERYSVRANPAEEAQPWAGYYWTADGAVVDGRNSAAALRLGFDKAAAIAGEPAGSVVMQVGYYRSNGFSLRCVRE